MAELHGELATAGGHGAEVADVTEHGGQRGFGLDADTTWGRLLALDHAAAAVEVADDVTDFFLRGENVEFHHWLKDLRSALDHGLAIRGLGGDFEGDVAGVNGVETTFVEYDFEVQAWITGKWSFIDAGFETFFDGGDELFRDAAAGDFRFEDEAGADFAWLDGVVDFRELSGPTGLLLVGVAVVDHLGDGFAIGDLWRTDGDLDLVGALEDVDLDVEVELAHALEDHFVGFIVSFDAERWIFLDHLADGVGELFSVGLVLRCDGDGNDGIGENHRLKGGRIFLVAKGVTGLNVFESDDGNDVAGLCGVYFLTVVGVHFDHAADTLGLAGEGVEHGIALLDGARVNAGEGECAELVVHDFESEAAERCFRIDDGKLAGWCAFGVHFWEWLDVGRGRQVIDDSVEHELEALVFERGTAVGREECEVDGALADALFDLLDGRLGAFEVGFHDVVVLFDGGLDELSAVFLRFIDHVGRDFPDGEIFWLAGLVPDVGFHGEQIDHADEVTFRADWQDHDERVCAENFLHLSDDAVEICTDPVELVDVNNASDFGVICVAPVGFRLRLNAAGTAEYADTAVEDFERTVNFDGEVNVARSVDDVELVVFPEASGGGGLDRDSALGFLFHEVHGGCAVVDLTDFVDLAGELENTFGGGGFARINVGEDADVAVFAEVLHTDSGFWFGGRQFRRRGQIRSRGSWFGNHRVGLGGLFLGAPPYQLLSEAR